MKPLKRKVSITLDGDLIDEIRRRAEADDRSFSQYINIILREYLRESKPESSHLYVS
ncbi:MAG TPA: toxin-antitoxin system protein [Lachnospiraceae bacterium]|nr:toxin-antitoxin system protein [Lachnospiraceae bacterium]